jgi:acylphosphatase
VQHQGSGNVRLTATVSGWVQGVGFRWSTMAVADRLRLVGFAENLANGDVLVVAEGTAENAQKLLEWLQGAGPRGIRLPGRVESVSSRWGPADGGYRRFSIR